MIHDRAAVLGIDAAWTLSEPSGVALWQLKDERWQCLRVAPSYAAFCGGRIDWGSPIFGGPISVPAILEKCRGLLDGKTPDVVAASIPLGVTPISGRRACDTVINKLFSCCKCTIHAPTPQQPGAVAVRLHQGFKTARYRLATAPGLAPAAALLEVYPHVAMLGLMASAERVPYKAFNTKTYWPQLPAAARRRRLVEEWRTILNQLGQHADAIDVPLPQNPEKWKFLRLKRFEDAIDALVCAWMAVQYLNGSARRMGANSLAAIWIPQSSLRYARMAGRKQGGASGLVSGAK